MNDYQFLEVKLKLEDRGNILGSQCNVNEDAQSYFVAFGIKRDGYNKKDGNSVISQVLISQNIKKATIKESKEAIDAVITKTIREALNNKNPRFNYLGHKESNFI